MAMHLDHREKDLGVIIDDTLKFHDHTAKAAKKANQVLIQDGDGDLLFAGQLSYPPPPPPKKKIEVWRSAHAACAYILLVTSVHFWRETSTQSMCIENIHTATVYFYCLYTKYSCCLFLFD